MRLAGWLAEGLAGWLAEAQRASKDTGVPAVGYVLYVFFVWLFRASRNTGAPAVGYCLVFLSCNFGPRRTLGLQLSGTHCVVFLSGNFWPRGKLGLQLSVIVLSFLEKPKEAQRGPERPREAQRGPEARRGPERPREAQKGRAWIEQAVMRLAGWLGG